MAAQSGGREKRSTLLLGLPTSALPKASLRCRRILGKSLNPLSHLLSPDNKEVKIWHKCLLWDAASSCLRN